MHLNGTYEHTYPALITCGNKTFLLNRLTQLQMPFNQRWWNNNQKKKKTCPMHYLCEGPASHPRMKLYTSSLPISFKAQRRLCTVQRGFSLHFISSILVEWGARLSNSCMYLSRPSFCARSFQSYMSGGCETGANFSRHQAKDKYFHHCISTLSLRVLVGDYRKLLDIIGDHWRIEIMEIS